MRVNKELEIARTKDAYDSIAPIYDGRFTRDVDLAENHITRELLDAQFKGRRNVNVLDIGCGTGFLLELVPGLSTYVGLDLSDGMLNIARQKYPNRQFFQGDMTRLHGFNREYFSHIVSTFGSFSYCLEPQQAVNAQYDLLPVGGKVFHMVFGHRYRFRRSHVSPTVTYITYGPKALRKLFSQFRNVEVTGLNLFDNPATMKWETAHLGKRIPGAFFYLILTGVK